MTKIQKIILPATFFFIISAPAFGAQINFEPQPATYEVGDSFTLSLVLNTEGQSVNAVELNIQVPQLLRVKSISKNGSAISLWVNEPSVSGKVISLTGGIPGGIKSSRALVAKITFEAAAAGQGNLVFMADSSVLLNDGEGTKLALQAVGGPVFEVIPKPKSSEKPEVTDEPTESEQPSKTPKAKTSDKKDNKKPNKFDIIFGTDPRIFNGKKFISFFTSDEDSGVDHYEVKLGKEIFKVAQSPFLIEDIEPRTVIKVRAYDSAENFRQRVYPGLFKRFWWQIVNIF